MCNILCSHFFHITVTLYLTSFYYKEASHYSSNKVAALTLHFWVPLKCKGSYMGSSVVYDPRDLTRSPTTVICLKLYHLSLLQTNCTSNEYALGIFLNIVAYSCKENN